MPVAENRSALSLSKPGHAVVCATKPAVWANLRIADPEAISTRRRDSWVTAKILPSNLLMRALAGARASICRKYFDKSANRQHSRDGQHQHIPRVPWPPY